MRCRWLVPVLLVCMGASIGDRGPGLSHSPAFGTKARASRLPEPDVYWIMDSLVSGTTIPDQADGGAYPLTVSGTGASLITGVGIASGNALSLETTGSHNVRSASSIPLPPAATISVWFRMTDPVVSGTSYFVWGAPYGLNYPGLRARGTSTTTFGVDEASGAGVDPGSPSLDAGDWVHAIVRNGVAGNTQDISINGGAWFTYTLAQTFSTATLFVGSNQGSNLRMGGDIAEIAIWFERLSDEESEEVIALGLAGLPLM